jgi:hypothetical protein
MWLFGVQRGSEYILKDIRTESKQQVQHKSCHTWIKSETCQVVQMTRVT